MRIIGDSILNYKGVDIIFNYKLDETQRNIIFKGIKTTCQRKFRSIIEYYNEINDIKVKKKSVDEWLEIFHHRERTYDEIERGRLNIEQKLLDILGVEKDSLYKAVMNQIREEIKQFVGE